MIWPRMAMTQPHPWRHAFRTTPMMPAMHFQLLTPAVIMRFTQVSHCVCRPARLIPPVPGPVMAEVGLLVWMPMPALGKAPLAWLAPDRPGTLAPDAVPSVLVVPCVTGAAPLVSRLGASCAAASV